MTGPGEVYWGDDSSERMKLIASKKKYAPARRRRWSSGRRVGLAMLVTLERNGVIESSLDGLRREAPQIQVPLAAKHAPNVYVSVAMISLGAAPGTMRGPS